MTTIANVLVLGDSNVGKTSLVHCLKYNTRLECPSSTVGIEFTTIQHNGTTYHVWDVEGLHTLSLISIDRFSYIFIVCDAADESTTEPFLTRVAHQQALITLVANKCDACANRPTGYLCTSAHTGENIEQLRQLLDRSHMGDQKMRLT